MSWLQALLDFLNSLVPWQAVRWYERGVRFISFPFRPGRVTGPHPPGLYFRLPVVYDMDTRSVVEQVVNLLNASFVTKDGRVVTVSANINYRITDAVQATVNVHDVDASIATEAMKYLHRTCRRTNLDTLLKRQGVVEFRVKEALQKKAENWGLEILDVGLTDLVPTRNYRLYGDPGTKLM